MTAARPPRSAASPAPARAALAGAAGASSDVAALRLGAGFGQFMGGLATISALSAVSDALFIADGLPLALCWAGAAVVLALAALRHRRRAWSGAAMHHIVGGAAVLMAVGMAVHVVVLVYPAYTMFLIIMFVSFGAMRTDRRWLLVSQAVAVAGFAAVALPRLGDPEWVSALTGVVFAVMTAHLLHRHTVKDQEQLQAMATALVAAATRDALTGLLNRQGLREGVDRLLAGRAGGAPGASTTAVCFDVDGFKSVNDELGHAAGDEVLVEVADALRAMTRPGDVVARLGGDEFVLLLPGVEPPAARALAERARSRLRGAAGHLGLVWSVSVGAATAPVRDTEGVEVLIRSADVAMYQDKRARRASADTALTLVEAHLP